MPDNVNYSEPGTGTVIATDQVGTSHYQLIKLAFGALDSATLVTATVGLPISDAGGSLTVDNGGTFAVQSATAGDVAHGATNAGNPLQAGYEAIAHGANPTAVTAGQRTKAYANRAGVPFWIGGHPNIVTIEAAYTAAQTDTAIVTVATGTKIAVTQIQVVTDSANTAFPQVRVGFGTANTPTTTGVLLTHPGLPAGGGVSRGDGSGILGVGSDDADLRVTCGAPTGGSLRVLCSYYTIES